MFGRQPLTGHPLASRREWLSNASNGFGMLALSSLLADEARAESGATPGLNHPAQAKNVILCFMDGGPSHVDTFDPKPMLKERQGEAIGQSAVSTKAQATPDRVWLGSPWEFRQRGESGLWVSDLLPNIAEVADELCVVRSLIGRQPLHGQQSLLLHTGRVTGSAPSMGSWVSYGLSSERDNLPNYVLLNNDWIPNGGWENFGSAFLPASHSATMLRAKGQVLDNITPSDVPQVQKRKLELIRAQDTAFAAKTEGSAIDSAIRNYETAFRLQQLIPDLADISNEPEAIRRMYGVDSLTLKHR
jgi:hypothetical protein